MEITIPKFLLTFLLLLQGITFIRTENGIQPREEINPLNNLILNDNTGEDTNQNSDTDHVRMKRQFGYYPYGYYSYHRPLPIIVGGIGIGIGRPGFGFGRPGFGFGGQGFGFGGRGFGFGGRGFGGRGFGGRGFGGRGFGGFGGRGFGGFGGRGGRG